MQKLCLVLLMMFVGCENVNPVKSISSVTEIQGKWKIIEITDPNGNSFEPDGSLEMVIEGNHAISDKNEIQLEVTDSYVKLFSTTNGVETKIGEVTVELTTDSNPVQMFWLDRTNPKQISLFQKEP